MDNFGGVSPIELAGMTAEIVKQMKDDYKLVSVRVISGTFLAS